MGNARFAGRFAARANVLLSIMTTKPVVLEDCYVEDVIEE